MADCVSTRGAGIGDDLARCRDAEGVLRIEHRLLGSVISHPSGGITQTAMSFEGAIIVLGERHPTTRRPDYRQLRLKIRLFSKRFSQCSDDHSGSAMQPV